MRRGDAVRIGWKDVKDNIIHFKINVFLPILPELATTLEIGPIGAETFICGKRGKTTQTKLWSHVLQGTQLSRY